MKKQGLREVFVGIGIAALTGGFLGNAFTASATEKPVAKTAAVKTISTKTTRNSTLRLAPRKPIDRPVLEPRGRQPVPSSNIVFIPGSDEPLYAEEPDKIIYLASLTKLVTADIFLDQISLGKIALTDLIPITPSAQRDTKYNHNSGIHGSITAEEALSLMLGRSYNDIAESIAQYVSGLPDYRDRLINEGFAPGTASAFRFFMAEKSTAVGARFSRFINAHGLPPYDTTIRVPYDAKDEDYYNISTASDMAKFYGHLITIHPQVLKYLGAAKIFNPATKKYEDNTNPLLENSEKKGAKPVPGVIAGKTGTSRRGLALGVVYDSIVDILGERFPLQAIILTFGNTTRQREIDQSRTLIQRALDGFTARKILHPEIRQDQELHFSP